MGDELHHVVRRGHAFSFPATYTGLTLRKTEMNRREFFRSGAVGALAGPKFLTELSGSSVSSTIESDAHRAAPTSKYSTEDERQRLQNVALCERSIHGCMRKHL